MDIRLPFVGVEKKQARYLPVFARQRHVDPFMKYRKKRSLAHSFFFSQYISDVLNLLGFHFDGEKHELTMFVLIMMDG